MVTALYTIIIIPIVLYVIFTIVEIIITYLIAMHKRPRSLFFVQASTEFTHTLLVFAYAQFMVTFSELLVEIGAQLYWPVALFMATLLLRGSLYLLLFYRPLPVRWTYLVLLATYLVGVGAIIWGLSIVIPASNAIQFVPDTSDMPIILGFGVPALIVFLIPSVFIYTQAFKRILQKTGASS